MLNKTFKKHVKKHVKKHSKKHSKKHVKKHIKPKTKRNLKHRKSIHKSMHKKMHKKSKKVLKGGFGKPSNLFPGNQWNGADGGNFFKLGTPIGVGGPSIYPGNNSPSPQTTSPQNNFNDYISHSNIAQSAASFNQTGGSTINPWTPSPLLNAYRSALGGMNNLLRQYEGLKPLPSSQPWSQHQQQL